MKKIGILGSTGSIGTQALEVIDQQKNFFQVELLTANTNGELLVAQAKRYQPNAVVIGDEAQYEMVKNALWQDDIKVYCGQSVLEEVVQMEALDVVLTALVGYAGLKPTIAAIKAGKHIALANKETLVVAGELINDLVAKHKVNLYPVDSEHSAIFQCLTGEFLNPIEKIYLTASGGPFRGYDSEKLAKVTKKQALKHPNWDMGAKITIDSASMMNKGLEVIEAKWLFDLRKDQIEVVVHPQSIVHSLVQFDDGSMKAQMGLPDMKLPIQYALTYPERLKNDFTRFNFLDYPSLTFEAPDPKTFRNLALAFKAMDMGGNAPCILNAANEVAVQAFLKDEVSFIGMSDLIEKCLEEVHFIQKPSLEDYVDTDSQTRIQANTIIKN